MGSRQDKRFFAFDPGKGRISVAGRQFHLPSSRPARIALGSLLVFGGIFSFLPILGLWMLPLGLLVLSQDFPFVRRWRRRGTVAFLRWREKRRAQR